MQSPSEQQPSAIDWGSVHSIQQAAENASLMKLRVSCVWCLVYLGFGCERYGKKEGFSNEEKKKVHDAATKIQQKTDVSIHENVPDYEEDSLSFLYSYMGVQLLDHWRNSWTLT